MKENKYYVTRCKGNQSLINLLKEHTGKYGFRHSPQSFKFDDFGVNLETKKSFNCNIDLFCKRCAVTNENYIILSTNNFVKRLSELKNNLENAHIISKLAEIKQDNKDFNTGDYVVYTINGTIGEINYLTRNGLDKIIDIRVRWSSGVENCWTDFTYLRKATEKEILDFKVKNNVIKINEDKEKINMNNIDNIVIRCYTDSEKVAVINILEREFNLKWAGGDHREICNPKSFVLKCNDTYCGAFESYKEAAQGRNIMQDLSAQFFLSNFLNYLKPKEIKVKIGKYEAIVTKDNVKVGCLDISSKEVRKIYCLVNKGLISGRIKEYDYRILTACKIDDKFYTLEDIQPIIDALDSLNK